MVDEKLTDQERDEYANPFAEARGVDTAPTAQDWEQACRNVNKLLGETELARKASESEVTRLREALVEAHANIAKMSTRAESAEAELQRLGYGVEVIDVITKDGTRFTSYVGDASWDTAENRARVREHHAALEKRVAELEGAHEQALNERDAAHAELEKILDPREGTHRNEIVRLRQVNNELIATRHAAESEVTRLRERAAELEAWRAAELEARGRYGFATGEQLAAANALLREGCDNVTFIRTRAELEDWRVRASAVAHLSAEPTAPTRTAAEQLVLEAMGEIPSGTLAVWAAGPCEPGWLGAAAKAELARREGK